MSFLSQSKRALDSILARGERRTGNKLQSGCACAGCTAACVTLPGIFGPGEVETAARYMGMSEKAFVKRFVVFDVLDDGTIVHRPRMIHENGATTSPSTKAESGPCVFLSPDGYCRVQAVKPAECVIYWCGIKETGMTPFENRMSIRERWIDAGLPLGPRRSAGVKS